MSHDNKSLFKSDKIITALWRNWALAYGALTLPLLLALWLPKVWISVLTLLEAWALASAMKSNYNILVNGCSLLLRVAIRVLMLTAVVMLAIVILCTDWLVPTVIHLEVYNAEIPFITCLIEFPIMALVCIQWLSLGLGDSHCRECQRRNGYYAGDSIGATLYYRETRYQVRILLVLSIMLGAVQYWYYFARFINSNINDPDRFFFNYMPTAVYLVSLIFMYGRYANIRAVFSTLNAASPSRRNRTVVRFMVFCGDELLVHQCSDGQYDTPAELVINRTPSIGDQQAAMLFGELTGLHDVKMRYCFTNDGFVSDSNIIHYAVFVTEAQQQSFGADDAWLNPYMLDAALASNSLVPALANEIFRIHTITMAWKTYDKHGKRRYPIRHYRPTFRFRDLPEWNVDYDDQTWFDVAHNNEDRRFFRLRSLWENMTDVFRKKKTADQ